MYTDRSILPPYGKEVLFERNPFGIFVNMDFYSWYNILGNLLLFLPMGFYFGLLLKNHNLKKNSLYLISISLFIELFQLVTCYFYFGNRTFDFLDIILNFVGGTVGYMICLSPFGKWIHQWSLKQIIVMQLEIRSI